MIYRPCRFCGEPLDPNSRYTWRRMSGWARRGSAGGSDVMLREPLGEEFAHDHCVRLAKNHQNPGQMRLT